MKYKYIVSWIVALVILNVTNKLWGSDLKIFQSSIIMGMSIMLIAIGNIEEKLNNELEQIRRKCR